MKINGMTVGFFALTLIGALAISGCSSGKHQKFEMETHTPTPPEFVTGPASALFTNAEGFSALVTVDSKDIGKSGKKLPYGRLVARGSHLLFAPREGDYTYLWDVTQHSGYVLSDSLQGYAPFSMPNQVASFTTISESAGPASEKVYGHHGHEAEVSVGMSDGSVTKFTCWRASDLGGLPIRISTVRPEKLLELHLTEARMEKVNPDLFQPPDGFTRFTSLEGMMLEKDSRGASMRNGNDNNGGSIRVPPAQKARSGQSRDD